MNEKTMWPVFPNWYPFNNMVFDGHMKVGEYEGVKSRNWDWSYRGPMFFYNSSSRVSHQAMEAYGYKRHPVNHKVIIGVGDLVDVRPFTHEEAMQMLCNFNNLSMRQVKKIIARNSSDPETQKESVYYFYELGYYIAPFQIGFFFKNLNRFGMPVPFNWPAGPVKPIFINPAKNRKLTEQLKLSGH